MAVIDFEQLNDELLCSRLKIKKIKPSLDRSLCELFKIKKGHGPKNSLPGCNFGPKFPAQIIPCLVVLEL